MPLPPGVPEVFTEPLPDPLGDLISRYARTHGPFAADAAAERYALGIAVVAGTLRRLAAAGRVVEGEFLPGGRGTEWCDAEVLRLLRRRCLARLRKEAEPAPPVALARLLPAWQGVRPIEAFTGRGGYPGVSARPRVPASQTGPGAVLDAIDQLAGAPIPASALETLVLPGRVPGYSPAMLDELTTAGEVVWTGAGALPAFTGITGDYEEPQNPELVVDTNVLSVEDAVDMVLAYVDERILAPVRPGGSLLARVPSEAESP